MLALKVYRISNFFYRYKLKKISKIIDIINYYLHNSILPGSCVIEKDTKVAYGGIGMVIHARTKIGEHCMLGQGITIGGRNGEKEVPIIERNVYIGAGARIIGNITIGHDSIIAPNSVVLKDVKPFSIIAGIPGEKINTITKHNIKKYIQNYGPLKYEEQ